MTCDQKEHSGVTGGDCSTEGDRKVTDGWMKITGNKVLHFNIIFSIIYTG
jgi:hypothetical protein